MAELINRGGCLTPIGKLCRFAEEYTEGKIQCKIARIKEMAKRVKEGPDLLGLGHAAVVVRSTEAFVITGVTPYITIKCAQGFSGALTRNGWEVVVAGALVEATPQVKKNKKANLNSTH